MLPILDALSWVMGSCTGLSLVSHCSVTAFKVALETTPAWQTQVPSNTGVKKRAVTTETSPQKDLGHSACGLLLTAGRYPVVRPAAMMKHQTHKFARHELNFNAFLSWLLPAMHWSLYQFSMLTQYSHMHEASTSYRGCNSKSLQTAHP